MIILINKNNNNRNIRKHTHTYTCEKNLRSIFELVSIVVLMLIK